MNKILVITLLLISTSLFGQKELVLFKSVPDSNSNAINPEFKHPYRIKSFNNEFYVIDAMANGVKVFSKDWKYLRQIGKAGEGDGDGTVREPFWFAINEKPKQLFIRDQSGRISIFKLNGDFIRSFRPPVIGMDFEVIDNKVFIVGDGKDRPLYSISDVNGKLIKEFGAKFDVRAEKAPLSSYLYENNCCKSNDSLFVIYKKIPYVQVISKKGEVVNTIMLNDEEITGACEQNYFVVKSPDKPNLIPVVGYQQGAVVKNGRIYIFIQKKNESKILVFNYKGALIDKIPLTNEFDLDKNYILFWDKAGDQYLFTQLFNNSGVRVFKEKTSKL